MSSDIIIGVLISILLVGLGILVGLATAYIRDADEAEKKERRRAGEEMTYKEFVAWCNERACDGVWGFNTVTNCINAMNEVKLSPPWAREAAWRRVNREHRIVEDFVKPTNKKIEEYLKGADDDTRPFKCDNGKIYMLPKDHCAFCDNCTDIFFDYTNGPYLFLCNKGCEDYETCGSFEEEDDEQRAD